MASGDRPLPSGAAERLREIRMLVFDVDGVLTDGSVIPDGEGGELKRFDVKDGAGLAIARKLGLEVALLSGRDSKATAQRARELGIERVVQGCRSKGPALEALAREARVELRRVGYMGDDLVDLPAMRIAGMTACPADAHPAVKAFADVVCDSPGGRGAVREWVEAVLTAQDKMDDLLRHFREGVGDA